MLGKHGRTTGREVIMEISTLRELDLEGAKSRVHNVVEAPYTI